MPTFATVLSFFATLFGPAADPECYALGGLDLARAEALADVNVAGLRAVYVDAAAASRDEQLLKRYAARGYRVVGAGMVRDECRAVSRRPGRVELDVSERMAHAWVVSETGEARRLPRDELTRHTIVLARADGGWRIASVG
jgi:hypothetical protein